MERKTPYVTDRPMTTVDPASAARAHVVTLRALGRS